MPQESINDLADFIRSTGPVGENPMPTGGNAYARAAAAASNGGQPRSSKPSIDGGRSVSSANMSRRLQARDAAIDYKDDNSDLIDFIRRGPPSKSDGPRIPRSVAPFRDTMDSDQLSVGGKAIDAQIRDADLRSSQASTNITDYSMPSVQSSINSQTGLLRNKALPGRGGAFDDDDMPMPTRKSRRARDPYSLDFSDEDSELDFAPPKRTGGGGGRRDAPKEESLADFLKNYSPPKEQVVQPLALSAATLQNLPRKKASSPSLGGSGGGGRGYIPIQINMPPGVDKYNPFSSSKSSSSTPAGGSGSTGRVPMKKFEPRDPTSKNSRSATSDLADFLRNSEPPSSGMPSGGYSSSRGPARKKSTVA
jgi:hypothetical protein